MDWEYLKLYLLQRVIGRFSTQHIFYRGWHPRLAKRYLELWRERAAELKWKYYSD